MYISSNYTFTLASCWRWMYVHTTNNLYAVGAVTNTALRRKQTYSMWHVWTKRKVCIKCVTFRFLTQARLFITIITHHMSVRRSTSGWACAPRLSSPRFWSSRWSTTCGASGRVCRSSRAPSAATTSSRTCTKRTAGDTSRCVTRCRLYGKEIIVGYMALVFAISEVFVFSNRIVGTYSYRYLALFYILKYLFLKVRH